MTTPGQAGIQTTIIYHDGRYRVERDSAGGYILTKMRGGNVYIQPGDDAVRLADALQDAMEAPQGNAVWHLLEEYF